LEPKEVAEEEMGWSNDPMRFGMRLIPVISQKDRQTKRAKELMDTAPEELEFW
jgi:hypothetical protein